MGTLRAEAVVTVYPFSQHAEGEEVTLCNATHSAFVSVPALAVELLTDLAAGLSVGQAQARFAQRHGETPDMDDFLAIMESEGFVAVRAEGEGDQTQAAAVTALPTAAPRSHFQNLSPQTARRLCSRPVVLSGLVLIGLALALVAQDPTLLPAPSVMVFQHDLTLLSITVTAFILATVFLHEMAHLVAARAAGAPARLGLSNRLWVLVAETDMTGIWMAPRRQRYLAFLAGPLLDAVSAALLIVLLWTSRRHWLLLPPLAVLLCRVFLFTYLVRLLWQCYLFVRTDFYYVLATLFNCKNLMHDTQVLLRNGLARLIPTIGPIDQSEIPARERRVIRCYALVWLTGRALASLLLISVPILWGYGVEIEAILSGSRPPSSYTVIDALTWGLIAVAIQGGGVLLWVRSLYRSRRTLL
jgi:hypothetical protein